MTVWVYLPLVLAGLLTLVARRIVLRGAPGPAAGGLAVVALLAAVGSTWSLGLLTLTLLDDLPPLSGLADDQALHLPEPVPDLVGLAAAVLLVVAATRLVTDRRRRAATGRRLLAAGSPQDGLVVADWAEPMAVAVPGRPGHLLITAGMLRLLDADERRVLFAHEWSHLHRRHSRMMAAAGAAAALNPLLAPVRDAVGFLVERVADEDAAAAVGDRELTARTVARAALATLKPAPAPVLGMHSGTTVDRVRALTEPEPPARRRRLLGLGLIGAASLSAIVAATAEFVTLARAWL
jgi:Zn-dependent protease with chaperone function